jgi:hypothetical protein
LGMFHAIQVPPGSRPDQKALQVYVAGTCPHKADSAWLASYNPSIVIQAGCLQWMLRCCWPTLVEARGKPVEHGTRGNDW